MRTRSARLALLAAAALGAVLSQQACSSSPEPEPGAAASPTPSAAEATTAGDEPTAGDTTGDAATDDSSDEDADSAAAPAAPAGDAVAGKKVPACTNDDVSVDITAQDQRTAGATRMALVTVTNKSSSTCRVEGRAAISLVNAAGQVVEVTTKNVNQPGKATPVLLRAGTTAWQGIKWTVCDKGDATCGAGNSLRFNLQASTDGPYAKLVDFPAPERSDITMASLQIGTLQPSNQGVVAW
ncbi:DUF4232 domain-containing protein [Symbioplanes lichenis]|uniref:DUF4232 domain-containing protein n=1 Tax=Symbioplanes lichenis TaxID=1629072 RepID=UPI002738C721|nr:DUF4232 domain-containing protein [Actinoplanes lichenis]